MFVRSNKTAKRFCYLKLSFTKNKRFVICLETKIHKKWEKKAAADKKQNDAKVVSILLLKR